tara:strand:- start:8092 stop:9822 length:1731 start_codon:yes stop_codon:yes gene_type:complete
MNLYKLFMMKKITLLLMLLLVKVGFSQSLPFDFSSANQLMTGDGDAVVSIEQDGTNDVLQMIGSGGEWDNAQINFADNVDLSDDANNTITFSIKPVNGTGSGDHLLKFEAPAAGGDIELAFTTTGTDWQTINLDFGAGLSNYGKLVIFTDKGAGNTAVDTYLIDDISGGTNITEEVVLPNLPFDFSSANQLMTGDGDALVSIEQDGTNDVLQMIGSGGEWDNAQINFGDNVDLSDDANNTITFKIKPVNGTGSGDHLLKFEAPAAGGDIELAFTTTGTDWQTISLDFGAGLSNYGKLVIFTDKGAGNNAVDTYLIDDISGGTNVAPPTPAEAPTTAAPVPPAMDASDVISLYSDAYSDIATNFDQGWCGASSVEEVMVAGNATMAYLNNDCQGIDFNAAIDASSFTHMHVDVYIDETDFVGKVFNLKFVRAGGEALEVNFNSASSPSLVGGTWISIDVAVDLSAFTDLKQFGITNNNKNNSWYDNLYFYKAATAGVSDNELLDVSMYPNPASDRLNISASNTIKNASIFNILGKKVMSLEINKNSESIDVSSLASGIYLIKYQLDNATGTAKFIKE